MCVSNGIIIVSASTGLSELLLGSLLWCGAAGWMTECGIRDYESFSKAVIDIRAGSQDISMSASAYHGGHAGLIR